MSDDKAGCASFMAAALALGALCSTAVLLLLYIGGNEILKILTNTEGSWSIYIIILGVGWLAQQSTLILQSAVASTQRFDRLALASSVGSVLSAVAVVASTLLVPNTLGFIIGTSIGIGVNLLAISILIRKDIGWIFKFQSWNASDLRALLLFARWQGAAHFAGAIGNQADRYVLGAVAPLQVVGQYNVAMRLQEVVHMGILKLSEVLFPYFSITTNTPVEKQAYFFVRANWSNNMISVLALAPLIPLADSIVTLWVGASAAEIAAPILRTLATAGVIGAGSSVYTYQAMAKGYSTRLAKINLMHAGLLISLTLFFIYTLGPLAAGAGYLAANIIRFAIATYFSTVDFSLNLTPSITLTYSAPPLLAGTALAWGFYFAQPAWGSNWPMVTLNYIFISIAVLITSLFATAMSQRGRELLKETYSWALKALRVSN